MAREYRQPVYAPPKGAADLLLIRHGESAPARPGARLRLRGQGMPDLRGWRGDLYVRLRVEIPRDLSPEQQQALLQLASLRGEHVLPQKKSLWKKMKDLLQ